MDELEYMDFQTLTTLAYGYLVEQQAICETAYGLSKYERWDYDQETGLLVFSDHGVEKLIIHYEDVGSVSLKSNTWLWSWDNSTTLDIVKKEIIKVKEYGQRRGFEKLTTPKWKAEIVDGWEMAGIAAYILQAKGAYRAPASEGNLYTFLIFKEIIRVDVN